MQAETSLENMFNGLCAWQPVNALPALPPPEPKPTRTVRPVTVEIVESIARAAADVARAGAFSCDDCFTTVDQCGAMICNTGFILRRLVEGGYLILADEPQEKRGLAFTEALRALNAGQKVRRACWPEGRYTSFFFDREDLDDVRVLTTLDDLEADDWEIVE